MIFGALSLKGQQELPIDSAGRALKEFYFSLNVGSLWIAGTHINWETGGADRPDATKGKAERIRSRLFDGAGAGGEVMQYQLCRGASAWARPSTI